MQLEKKGDVFEKEVHLPAIDGKIQYKVRLLDYRHCFRPPLRLRLCFIPPSRSLVVGGGG